MISSSLCSVFYTSLEHVPAFRLKLGASVQRLRLLVLLLSKLGAATAGRSLSRLLSLCAGII